MKIAISSDWHGSVPNKQDRKLIKSCDALLLAGDIFENCSCFLGNAFEAVGNFLNDLKDAGVRVIMTPGNHDFHLYNGWLKANPEKEQEFDDILEPRRISSNSIMRAPFSKDRKSTRLNSSHPSLSMF